MGYLKTRLGTCQILPSENTSPVCVLAFPCIPIVPPTKPAMRLVVWEMVDALLVEEELEVALDKGQRPQNELDLPSETMVEAFFGR